MNPMEREELDWLAFRYVASELDSDEQTDFESRLADDQAACEAVAEAVELTGAIRVVEAASLPTVQLAGAQPRRRSLRLVACLSACALLLIISFQLFPQPESGSTVGHGTLSATAIDSAELAVIWSEIREEPVDQEGDSWAWLDVIDVSDSPSAIEDTDLLIAPDWMFSAVVGVETDGSMNLPEERKDG